MADQPEAASVAESCATCWPRPCGEPPYRSFCKRREVATVAYACALCGGPITVADNAHGGLITVNVDGHGKAAHRTCPEPAKVSEPWRCKHGVDTRTCEACGVEDEAFADEHG